MLKQSNFTLFDQQINSYFFFDISIQFLKRKMVEFTTQGLFFTTNGGLPDITNLPPSLKMPTSYFVYSLLLQIIFMLFFIAYFILSVFRVMKKIKNDRFLEEEEDDSRSEKMSSVDNDQKKEKQEIIQETPIQENLVYRFDDDEFDDVKNRARAKSEAEKEQKGQTNTFEKRRKLRVVNKKAKEAQKEENIFQNEDKDAKEIMADELQKKQAQEYNNYHYQHEQEFINLDNKLLFMQPFLISFIVSNNMFTTDPMTIAFVILMLASFFLINIKGWLSGWKVMQVAYMVFGILGFLPYFVYDHDITT